MLCPFVDVIKMRLVPLSTYCVQTETKLNKTFGVLSSYLTSSQFTVLVSSFELCQSSCLSFDKK